MFRRLYFLWKENNRDQSDRSFHLSRRNRIKSAMMDEPSSGRFFQIKNNFRFSSRLHIQFEFAISPINIIRPLFVCVLSKTCVHANIFFQQTIAIAALLFSYIWLFSLLISCR